MTWHFREVNQNNWHKELLGPWLENGDIPADVLKDARTGNNSLSLYVVQDDRSNLRRLAAALQARRPNGKLDYILFDSRIISAMNLSHNRTAGNTPDNEVNQWHIDVQDLSGRALVHLLTEIAGSDFEVKRFTPREMEDLVNQAVESGHILYEELSPSYKKKISGDSEAR